MVDGERRSKRRWQRLTMAMVAGLQLAKNGDKVPTATGRQRQKDTGSGRDKPSKVSGDG